MQTKATIRQQVLSNEDFIILGNLRMLSNKFVTLCAAFLLYPTTCMLISHKNCACCGKGTSERKKSSVNAKLSYWRFYL